MMTVKQKGPFPLYAHLFQEIIGKGKVIRSSEDYAKWAEELL